MRYGSGPPPARQEITLIADTPTSYVIPCQIIGVVVLLMLSNYARACVSFGGL